LEDFEKKNNNYKIIMLVLITAFITFMVTSISFYNYYVKSGKGITEAIVNNDIEISNQTTELDTKIEVLKKCLENSYLGDINEENLISSALKGYVNGLGDTYTEYLTKEEYDELMISVNGNYVGIGIYMTKDKNDNVLILMPIEGSPAEEVGLQTGDIITKVNGEECNTMDLNIVATKVKGEEGTTVELEILRGTETFTKTITRRSVVIKDMESKVLDGNIGYIKILSFDDGCGNEFKEKLTELKSKGIKSLIIDVRDNGGGVVADAIEIADMLTPKDVDLMLTIDKNEKQTITKSEEESFINGMNVVILTNENSASASEILVGALKDNNVAKVVGTTSFGKGVMQEIIPLNSSIGGALKVTIQEFRTPNGNVINKKGIEPDVVIEEANDTTEDVQLNKAIELVK